MPHDCLTEGDCVDGSERYWCKRYQFPGHGWTLADRDSAWEKVKEGLIGAGHNPDEVEDYQREFYRIPRLVSRVCKPVYVIVVRIPDADEDSGVRYFGLETEVLDPPYDSALFLRRANVGPGAQLNIKYRADGEVRRAHIWLKQCP